MNKQRRKEIREVVKKLNAISSEVDGILAEEQMCFENLPEGLQTSYNGMLSEDAQNSLTDAINAIDEAIEYLEEI